MEQRLKCKNIIKIWYYYQIYNCVMVKLFLILSKIKNKKMRVRRGWGWGKESNPNQIKLDMYEI